jgi:hypothetical protein
MNDIRQELEKIGSAYMESFNIRIEPWEGEHACTCGGAGAPCRRCNPSDEDAAPRPPKGFGIVFDKKGWRH